ncbi:MAG: hypothetical protein JWO10_524, partial [Microbacteriaceae bacterium]|nr:hypothetical protein [Microbacteriaceae bacterium]
TPNGEGGYSFGDPVAGCPPLASSGEGFDFQYGEQVQSCTFGSLAPGIWNVYSGQQVDLIDSTFQDDYIMIPSAPGFGAVVNDDRSVTASGVGTPGYLVAVLDASASQECATTVGASGSWACTFTPQAGAISLTSQQQSQGFVASPFGSGEGEGCDGVCSSADVDVVRSFQGYSAYSSTVQLVVPAAPVPETPTVTPKPVVTTPLVWTLGTGGKDSYEPGDQTDLTGSNLPPGAPVSAELHSTPVALGSTVVGADGTFLLHVTIPADTEPGTHHFVVTVSPAGEEPSVVEQAVTVMPLPVVAGGTVITTDPSADSRGSGSAGGTAHGLARDEPTAPNVLSGSISTVQDVLRNPVVVGSAAVAGLALLIFVAFPAELLNSTVEENYARFSRRLPKKAAWWTRFEEWLSRSNMVGALTVTTVAAVIFAFADPGVGFDITTLRMILASGIGLLIVGYVASVISGAIIRRRWKLSTIIELRPLGLVLTLLGVVLSRVIDFAPGILIGLILGLTIAGRATKAQEAKATLVEGGVIFGFAILAWAGYSLLTMSGAAGSWGGALVRDSLVAVAAEGLTALFIGMLPFRFLDGSALFAYRKWLWAVVYVVVAIAFVGVVLPSSSNWGKVGESVWVWVIVLGSFTVLSVGIYLLFRRLAGKSNDDEEEELPEHAEPPVAAGKDS